MVWLKAINRKDLKESSLKYSTVCSRHFISGKSAKLQDVLSPDWVPSLKLGYTNKTTLSTSARYERSTKRSMKNDHRLTVQEQMLGPDVDDFNENYIIMHQNLEVTCQTEGTSKFLKGRNYFILEFYLENEKEGETSLKIEELQQKIHNLTQQNKLLREKNFILIGVLRQKFLVTTNRQPITAISKKFNGNMYSDYG